jgi:hypothetical protein
MYVGECNARLSINVGRRARPINLLIFFRCSIQLYSTEVLLRFHVILRFSYLPNLVTPVIFLNDKRY